MKKICFHTGASVLITDAQNTIKKIAEIVDTFIGQKDEIHILWCADSNIDQALDGPLGSEELKKTYYECVDILASTGVGEYIPNPTDEAMTQIANTCDAYYGDNGYLMGLFINAGKPVMKMDL